MGRGRGLQGRLVGGVSGREKGIRLGLSHTCNEQVLVIIIIIQAFVYHTMSACKLNLTPRQSVGGEDDGSEV